MRYLAVLFVSLSLAGVVSAQSLGTGTFELYSKPGYQPTGTCDVGVRLVLDKAEILGRIAYLENFVHGVCELHVSPNPRMYRITSVEDAGCGSVRAKGSRQDSRGVTDIEIVDHRRRVCEDLQPAVIIVTEKGPEGQSRLYSASPRSRR